MRSLFILPILVGLLCLTAYLALAGPTFYWLDSSELSAAAWELGIPHPPGHPLPSLLGRLLCLLPLGTLAFRATLASALAGAMAAALVVVLSLQVSRRLGTMSARPAWLAPAAATLAGLTVGFSYALGFQAVRAEVYALNLCLLLAGACLLLRWDETGDRRPLLLAGLVGGLALCNHHFLVVLALPGMLMFILARRRQAGWGRAALGLCLCGLLGLSTLAYLPLRSARGTEVDWGSPHTAERFFWVVSAKAFQKAVNKAGKESVEHRAMGAVFAVVGGLGPLAATTALGGLYFLWRGRRSRRAALLLTSVAGFNLLSPLTVGFDPLNPDAHGYLAVAVAFLAPGLAALLVLVGGTLAANVSRRRWAPALVIGVGLIFPAYQAAANLNRCDLRRHWDAEETARAQLDVKPRALVLSAYFGTVFNYWAMRVLADHRPDTDMFHRHFLPMPGRMERLQRRLPEVAAVAPAWLAAQHLLPPGLETLSRQRPVAVEYDLNLRRDVVQRLKPGGMFLDWGSRAGSDKSRLAAHWRQVTQWRDAVGPVTERETVRAVMYTHYLLAHYACATGNSALARLHHGLARRLGPASSDLARLAKSCGLE